MATIPDALAAFIDEVPKVELHLHLVGSASPTTVAALAAERPEAGVPSDLDELVEFSLLHVRREQDEPRYQWPRLTQLVTRRELVGGVAEPEIRAALVGAYAVRAEMVAGRVPHMSADEWRDVRVRCGILDERVRRVVLSRLQVDM